MANSGDGVVQKGALSGPAEVHQFAGGFQDVEQVGVFGDGRFEAARGGGDRTDAADLGGRFEAFGQ